MNILFTLNKNYINQTIVLLASLFETNPGHYFNIYIMSKDLNDSDLNMLKQKLPETNYHIHLMKFDDSLLKNAPISKRYPLEIYYRLFAPKVLPKSIEKILYLDPDIVIINKIDELYNMDFDNNYIIGATHVREFLRRLNQIRLGVKSKVPYINTGVMLMNLNLMRSIDPKMVYDFIDKKKHLFALPDQDILFSLFGDKIKLVDYRKFNLSDRLISVYNLFKKEKIRLAWVKKHTAIIHYCGRNKPWKKKYKGILDVFYKYYANKIKIS